MILICLQLLVALIFVCRKDWLPRLKSAVKSERELLFAAGLAMGILLLIWVGIAATRIGITPDNRYWNEAGVPVLGFQILLAWTVSLGFALVCFIAGKTKVAGKVARFFSTLGLDLIICLALWITAAILWSQSPMDRSYFAPGPYPPNFVFYPYSDAETHDLGAQYVLIGQGLNNNQYHDKPFYMLFLTVSTYFAGQDYLAGRTAASDYSGIIPAILYLIGKLIHSRTAGILVGIFVIFQQTEFNRRHLADPGFTFQTADDRVPHGIWDRLAQPGVDLLDEASPSVKYCTDAVGRDFRRPDFSRAQIHYFWSRL